MSNTLSDKRKLTFLRRGLEKTVVAKSALSDKRKLTFLRHGLEKTVVADIALDLEVSQPFLKMSKHALSRNFEKSRTLGLPVDLEKILKN